MIIDRDLTALANFYALVKESNPFIDLTDVNVIVGVPEVVEGPNGTNTKIAISSVKNKGYSGVREVFYKRCSLTEGIVNPITSLQVISGESTAAFGGRIRAALNLHEGEIIVNGGSGWTLSGNQVITSKANSLIYLPGVSYDIEAVVLSGNFLIVGTLGSYSAIPVKGNRETNWYIGQVGRFYPNHADTTSSHIPAAGTMVGSFENNPGNNVHSFYSPRNSPYISANTGALYLNYLPELGPAEIRPLKVTNLDTNDEVVLQVQLGHAPEFTTPISTIAWGEYQTGTTHYNLATLGISPGSRLSFDLL